MESFIDGDLAANNGGWQWTASTGTDPQPYFVCPFTLRLYPSLHFLCSSEHFTSSAKYPHHLGPSLFNDFFTSLFSVCSRDTNPQRIFNTVTQSEKCDPNGDYIRYWVPELKHLKGKAIHDPYHNMPKSEFKKLGYPEPIVDHKTARLRALFRYKNVGEKEEGA
jgi:deoxyribodipyrimidine photo-lyase